MTNEELARAINVTWEMVGTGNCGGDRQAEALNHLQDLLLEQRRRATADRDKEGE